MKILMVCLGNICRSPLADGLLRRKVAENRLVVEVDSAGTSGYHTGEAPDKRMMLTAANHNTPIDFLKARKFIREDFDRFDHIFVMDQSNYSDVLELATTDEHRQKVKLILEEIEGNAGQEVPDPYYSGFDGFENVYALLDQATNQIIEKIKTNTL